ncbi:hypothetical protein LZD49_09985 [Dyadobacter sp. CY261]|uniref:hypothetical protein n=1 Tax=Dyadobacter sp. CY261 TaxID=2907203 RepID=UPI001F3A7B71|nr:hypothetical protein [Dyadobacter sp. CY261]MCF0070801.1 hypothetical protein [Dyadobacter sp. CY261]
MTAQYATRVQQENVRKALSIFIDFVRDYFVKLLSAEYGGENWAGKYRNILTHEQRPNWDAEIAEGHDPRNLIDYPHFSSFCYEYRNLLKRDFGRAAGDWTNNFKKIYTLRNSLSHYRSDIDVDLIVQFWIYVRAFARCTNSVDLYNLMLDLEHAPAEQASEGAGNADRQSKPLQEISMPKIVFPNAHFFLPILVRGKSLHMVQLCPENEAGSGYIRNFNFEQNIENIHLFSLVGGACQGHTTASGHQTVGIESAQVTDNSLVVSLRIVDEVGLFAAELSPGVTVKLDASGKNQTMLTSRNVVVDHIVFRLQKGESVFLGKIKTAFAPTTQIYDLALDFGSEASQVVVHPRAEDRSMNRKELLQLVWENFYPGLVPPFHQQDADKELFRSQLFVKKEDAVMEKYGKPNQADGADVITILTTKDKIDELKRTHALVTNSKLAHLGAYNFRIKYRDRKSNPYRAEESEFGSIALDVQQMAINHFLHALLSNIHAQKNDENKLYVNIKLLIPNILEQALLSRLINLTYQFFDQPEVIKTYNIGGAEVGTLSESDASFLGYWTVPDVPQNNANYLIVDVGKGTTDFSIIKSDNEYNLSSEFRSGFVGAGNVISYAFIETIVVAVLGGETASWDERKKLLNIIASEQTDIAAKYNFLEIIEHFKHNFEGESSKAAKLSELIPANVVSEVKTLLAENISESSVLSVIVDALNVILKSQETIRDDFGFIHNAVKKLVRKLKGQVIVSDPENVGKDLGKISKIVLTGRGFLFRMLVDEVRQEMGRDAKGNNRIVIQDIKEISLNQLKKICLSGAFSNRKVSFDANIVGLPGLHTLTEVNTAKGPDTYTKIEKGYGKPAHLKTTWFEDTFHAWIKDDFVYDDIDEPVAVATPTQPEILRFFAKGTKFAAPYNPNIHSVHISGIKYHCEGLDLGEAIDLIFDGEQFWLRTETGLKTIAYPREFMRNSSMVWQTLFPFFGSAAGCHMPIDNSLPDSFSEI